MTSGGGERIGGEELACSVVVEPVFPRLEALRDGVIGGAVVSGSVLAGRVVAAADVAAEGAAAQVEPPSWLLPGEAFGAPGSARRHRGLNTEVCAGHGAPRGGGRRGVDAWGSDGSRSADRVRGRWVAEDRGRHDGCPVGLHSPTGFSRRCQESSPRSSVLVSRLTELGLIPSRGAPTTVSIVGPELDPRSLRCTLLRTRSASLSCQRLLGRRAGANVHKWIPRN